MFLGSGGTMARRGWTDQGEGSVAFLTFVLTAALGIGAYLHTERQVNTAEAALATTKKQLDVSKGELKVAQQTLKARQQELKAKQQELEAKQHELDALLLPKVDDATARIEATRLLFQRAKGSEARGVVLRHFARQMRESSKRTEPLTPYSNDLPSGLHESAAFLKRALVAQPTTIDLSGIDLHGHYWAGAKLDRILLLDTDLRAVTLAGGSYRGASFENAVMRCADLKDADLADAELKDADLSYSDLRGVDLRRTKGLTAGQLRGISWDGGTKFPTTAVGVAPPEEYVSARACAQHHLLRRPQPD